LYYEKTFTGRHTGVRYSLLFLIHSCVIIIKGRLKYPHLDYKLALKEYSLVGGRIPLPPRYAFGVFYSRYRAYNDIGEMVQYYCMNQF
jgi:alpha-glucosidase (family GH31 glycosyl hydrolase)